MNDFSSTNLPKGFYVYMYLREDGSPYYVGKGHKERAWSKRSRSTYPPRDLTRIKIFKADMQEVCALSLERILITKYGRKDIGTGILRNRTSGGDGVAGYIFTAEHKRKLSESGKGRKFTKVHCERISKARKGMKFSAETCRRISEGKKGVESTFKGKKHTQQAKEKMSQSASVRVVIDGVFYKSLLEASKILNVKYPTLYTRLNSTSESFKDCQYAEKDIKHTKIAPEI